MNKFNRQNGFSQILILIIISFLAIALPITTKLVQKAQDNRSSAAVSCGSYTYGQCISQGSSSCSWDSKNQRCIAKSVSAKVNGRCGSGNNSCVDGTWKDETDTITQFKWTCLGINGGSSIGCSYGKPTTVDYYYYSSSSKSCISGRYSSSTVCKSSVGASCYEKKSDCETANINAIGKCDTSKLYGCLNGSLSNKKYSDLNYTWTCGSTNCSVPGSFCSYSNRALGCPCQNNNSLCASGICSNKICVSSYADAGCKYAGSIIPTGQSQCFNAFWGAYSDLVRCDIVNGKPKAFIVKSYKKANCEGVDVKGDASGLGCAYGGTTLVNGQHQCFNVFMKSGVAIGSVMIACDNGVHRTEARYPRQNCVEGNRKADEVDTTEDKEDVDTPAAEEEDGTTTPNDTLSKFYYGSNCVEGNYKSYNDCVSKTGQTCYVNKDVCLSVHSIKYNLYSKASETCDSSTGNWKCTYIVNSSRPGDGITTFTDKSACEGASGCEKSSPGPGPGPGPGPSTIICTANAVSTTACYDSTHLQKCNSEGSAWIQGDQCATGQVCSNGVCGVGTTGASKLSFRIAFDGVGSAAFSCLDNFKTVKLTVGKIGTTLTEEKTVGITRITGVGSENSKGYIIFEAKDVALGVGFSGATNVYAKIKGQVHARMYYCTKGQSSKSNSQVCDLALNGTVNNFYEYPILGGDVNQDGVVNTADFSVIKNDLNEEGCNYKTDLNGDGKVNGPDIKIFKVALEAKYDE